MIKMKLLAFLVVLVIGYSTGKVVEGPRHAQVTFHGHDVDGKITMEQASINSPVKIRGYIHGLEPGLHGVYIHAGSNLGSRCESVGRLFIPADVRDYDKPVGYLGNVKTYTGNPSRTDISLFSTSVSLFEGSARSIIDRPLVIHALAEDYSRSSRKYDSESSYGSERLLGCGLIKISEDSEYHRLFDRSSEESSSPFGFEKSYKLDKIEQGILDGEKPWENVRHPHYGGSDDLSTGHRVRSNLNIEGIERPDLSADSLSLKSATSTRKIWMVGYTYEYDYSGTTSTGIFGISTKVAGGSIKGRLVIEPVDESTINVALLNTKAKMFNEDVMEKYEEADPGSFVRVVDQEHLEKPMQIKIVAGKVESVAIGKEEPLWVVNFKRALAAQIQMQFDGSSGVFQKSDYNNYYAENAVYHTMEGSVTGECQTWYHISRLPNEQIEAEPKLLPFPELCENFPVYEIVKNRDLDKCRILPTYHYNSNQGLNCDVVNGAGCENKYAHADTVKIIGCTSNEGHFIVQRIKSVDKLVQKPMSYETEATEGHTVQILALESLKKSDSKLASRLNFDVHHYQTLVYSYDEDYKIQGPLMGKPSLRDVNSPFVMDVEKDVALKEAERLHSEIVSDLESDSYYNDPSSKHVSGKINMLRRALYNLEYAEIYSFVNRHWENKEYSTSNQILLDTLILTGTNPSLMIVREMILKGRVVGELAVQAMSTFVPNVETPTKEFFSHFMDFLKSEVVENHRQLKITTALSLSRLVYQACINSTMALNMFPKLVMGEFCSPSDSFIVNQLVPYLTEELKTATDDGERIAMLTALGNIGHEMILPSVVPFITSCEPSNHHEAEYYERNQREFSNLSKKEMREKWYNYKKNMNTKKDVFNYEQEMKYDYIEDSEDLAGCNIVRSKAIFALSNLALEKNEVVASILMPIVFNKDEEVEIRLSALSLLFVSNPPQAFWNRIALSTWFEPNDQVAHYIYTTVASMVMNKDPKRRHVTVRAEAVLPLMKPMYWTSYVAINYLKSDYSEKTRLGYLAETITFPGYESFFPSHHYQSLYLTVGPWFTKFFEHSISSKHLEKFMDRLIGKPGLRGGKFRDESDITSPELNKIHDELKIEARATGKPELYVYLNFLDNYQRFYTINPTTIYNYIEKQLYQRGFKDSNGHLDINYHKYLPLLDSLTRVPSSMGLAYTMVGHHSILLSLKTDIKGGFSFSSMNAKVEGVLKPVLVYKMSNRLMTETPWARSYPTTGIDFQNAIALPGLFSVEGEYRTAKVQTSWEFLGDKIHALKYSVIPFTTIRKINDFTPALLLKDTKRVSYLEEPVEEKYYFGERALGMNWIYTKYGDIQAFKAPMSYSEDWFGSLFFYVFPKTLRHGEWNLYLDNSKSETKAIKTFFSFASKTADKHDAPVSPIFSKSLFKTVYGEKIKSNKYVNEYDQDWTSEKFQHIFQYLSNPTGYSIDFSVEFSGKSSSQSRRFGSSFAYGMDSEGKAHRGSFLVEKERHDFEDESEGNFVLCAELDVKLPEYLVFKRKEMIPKEAEHKSIFTVGFGKSCTNDRKIIFTSEWTRSEDEISPSLLSKFEETQCRKHEHSGRGISDECQSTQRLSALLNKNVMTIDYNEMPALLRNVTYKASNAFRYFYGHYMSDNQIDVRNVENQIRIESTYYPLISVLDFNIYKPRSNTFFNGITIHPLSSIVLPKRMAVPRPVLAAPGVCLVGKSTVTTYDGLFYNATLTGCDHVITKDCSGRYKFAVLAREEDDKKVITVLLNKEKIEVYPGLQKAKVNGMEFSINEPYLVKDAENKILAQVRRMVDGFYEIDSPSHWIRVTFDTKEVVVLGSPIHRGRLCGLCGSQTGEKETDLTGPRECSLPRDLMDVAYELKHPSGCKSFKPVRDYEMLRRIQDECLKEKSSNVYGLTDSQPLFPKFQQSIYSTYARRSISDWTLYRNKMIVRENTRCFSTESVPKCKEGSRPVDIEERKLGFHCIPRNHLSEQLSQEIPVRPLDELIGKEVDVTQVFNVPTSCLPL